VDIIYNKYYAGKKMRGYRNCELHEKINGIFICLVATALRHYLKQWVTGELAEEVAEFKYETVSSE